MKDTLEFCGVLLAAVVVIVIIVGGIMAAISRLEFPMKHAEIEQLRQDAANVDPADSEDVIGQVTQWNQTIQSNKTCNQVWWCDLFITDKWNDVPLIPVPKR